MKLLPVVSVAGKPPSAHVVAPLVHLNGTSCADLLGQYQEAINALMVAETALVETAPNARDYYPQGDDAFLRATVEHGRRLTRLTSIKDEIETILEDLSNGGE